MMKTVVSFTRLIVTYLALSALRLDPKNPRSHTPLQIRRIARSIEAFGFVVPVLVDRSKQDSGWSGSLSCCAKLRTSQSPSHKARAFDRAQARALCVADNHLCEIGTWDEKLLAQTFKELSEIDLGFDLDITGFSHAEIDLRIEGLSVATEEAPDPADNIPGIENEPPITKPGDLWQLGTHWVLCDAHWCHRHS